MDLEDSKIALGEGAKYVTRPSNRYKYKDVKTVATETFTTLRATTFFKTMLTYFSTLLALLSSIATWRCSMLITNALLFIIESAECM